MTGVAAVVGALVATGFLLAAVSRRRIDGVAVPHGPRRADRHKSVLSGRRTAQRWLAPRRRPGVSGDGGRLASVLVAAASMLRAGTAPADAWSLVLRTPVPDRVPTVAQLAVATVGASARRARGSPRPPVEAVVAAATVADELGAPLAGVLDQLAAAVAARAEAAADVEAALAGPRSSARVLMWLPLLGVVLGTALGADPLGVLLGGGLGTVSGVLGAVLVVAGRWWTGALLRRAAGAEAAT